MLLSLISFFTTIVDKSPCNRNAVFISGFPHKKVHPFRNFLEVLPSPTIYRIETRKKFGIHASNFVCGVREEVAPV